MKGILASGQGGTMGIPSDYFNVCCYFRNHVFLIDASTEKREKETGSDDC